MQMQSIHHQSYSVLESRSSEHHIVQVTGELLGAGSSLSEPYPASSVLLSALDKQTRQRTLTYMGVGQ